MTDSPSKDVWLTRSIISRLASVLWGALRRPSNFGTRVLQTAATNLILAFLAAVAGVLAARFLGPEGRGQLAAVQVWPFFLAKVAVLGMPEAVLFFSSRDRQRAGTVMGSALALALITTILIGGLAFFLLPLLLSAQEQDVVQIARSYLWYLPIFVAWTIPLSVLPSQNDFLVWNAARLLQYLGWPAILCIAWGLGRDDVGFVTGVHLVFFLAATVVLNTSVIPGRLGTRVEIDRREWRPLLDFGLPSLASSASQLANFRLDQLLIAFLLPSRTLGFYVAAVTWGLIARPLLLAVSTVLFPRVAAERDEQERLEAFHRGVRAGSSLVIVIAVVLVAITPFLLPVLFGDEFRKIIPAASLLVVGGALYGWNGIVEAGLRGFGQPRTVMRVEVIGGLVTAVCVVVLARPLGILGAAAGSLIGYGTTSLLLLQPASRIAQVGWWRLIRPSAALIREGALSLRGLLEPDDSARDGGNG